MWMSKTLFNPFYSNECKATPIRGKGGQAFDDEVIHLTDRNGTIQEREPNTTSETPKRQVGASMFSGWRGGASSASCCTLLSLGINIGVAAWLAKYPDAKGAKIRLWEGNCQKVHTINLWVHLGINALSTVLLGGSNYCMQCLVAPTRAEIDQAHRKGQWLDVGIPSLRNQRNIAKGKQLLWLLLGLASVQLCILFFLSATGYLVLYATEDFVNGAEPSFQGELITDAYSLHLAEIQNSLQSWDRLDNLECIQAYANDIPTEHGTLVIVSSNHSNDASSLLFLELYDWAGSIPPKAASAAYDPFTWMCRSPNVPDGSICYSYLPQLEADASEWAPYGWQAEYCLSEPVPRKCALNANFPIIIVVIFCNAVKLAVMLLVTFRLRGRPLITIGDAIESFLDHPDATSLDLCLLSKEDVVERKIWPKQSGRCDSAMAPVGLVATKQRWKRTASRRQWVWTMALMALAIILVLVFLVTAIHALPTSFASSLWELGFGSVNGKTFISGWAVSYLPTFDAQIIASVLVANSPQLILSLVYMSLNALLTVMFLGREWNSFAYQRKTLRVSSPTAEQRSSYLLQLPYKAAIPTIVISGVLHWLVSQSIFLAVVDNYGMYTIYGDNGDEDKIATCGFSPVPMIIVIVIGICMMIVISCLGQLRYEAKMPLVGSCSVAIAAACHRPQDDEDASLKPVQWGVVGNQDWVVGHCTFTSHPVEPLREGRWYAGARGIGSQTRHGNHL